VTQVQYIYVSNPRLAQACRVAEVERNDDLDLLLCIALMMSIVQGGRAAGGGGDRRTAPLRGPP